MTNKIKYILLLAIFIGGFSSLSLELVVMRQLSGFVGSTAVTASIIIGIFLAFMSWGYYNGSVMPLAHKSIRRLAAEYFVIISLMIMVASSYILIDLYFIALNAVGITSNIVQTFIYSLAMLSIGPYLFGKIVAMLSRCLHRYNHNYTGRIMAIDTIGSVLGSIMTTLVIMPFIGVNHTIVVLVIITLFGSYILSRHKYWLSMYFIIITAVLLNQDQLLYNVYRIIENNAVSTISIHRTDDGKSKEMVMNGGNSSKISTDKKLQFEYVRFVEDNYLEKLPKDRPYDILIIGAGGFTMGLDDKYNQYTYVDVDKSLQRISEKYFLERKLDKNKKFVVQDANQFLKESTEKYDFIVLDTYSSRNIIPLDLVTEEYFLRVKNNLKPGGIVAMNIVASPDFSTDFSMNIDNTLRHVFKDNLQRQVMGEYDAWCRKDCLNRNVMYVYYNHPNPGRIYNINKNSAFYDM